MSPAIHFPQPEKPGSGAVMFGWGVVLFMLVREPFARGEREGWYIIPFSILAWFIPDMAYSLWTGFWQNAILNLVFALLFLSINRRFLTISLLLSVPVRIQS